MSAGNGKGFYRKLDKGTEPTCLPPGWLINGSPLIRGCQQGKTSSGAFPSSSWWGDTDPISLRSQDRSFLGWHEGALTHICLPKQAHRPTARCCDKCQGHCHCHCGPTDLRAPCGAHAPPVICVSFPLKLLPQKFYFPLVPHFHINDGLKTTIMKTCKMQTGKNKRIPPNLSELLLNLSDSIYEGTTPQQRQTHTKSLDL